jgi:hypothetical protein
MAKSNAFAGALIMLNTSASSHGGLPCSTNTDPLDSNCFTTPEAVRDALQTIPPGHKLIGIIDGHSEMGGNDVRQSINWDRIGGGFFGPWAENSTKVNKQRWGRWAAALKAVGGEIDVIHVDAEWSGWFMNHHPSFAEQRSTITNETGVWKAVVADARWPALLAQLNLAGEEYNLDFSAANLSDMPTWTADPTDMRAHVWDSVMFQRYATLINQSYFEPIREVFPAVKGSNYAHSYTPPAPYWTYMTGSGEMAPPFAGAGAHVGTHQSKSFYFPEAQITQQCTVKAGPSSKMGWCWSFGTPFWERKLVRTVVQHHSLVHVVLCSSHSPWSACAYVFATTKTCFHRPPRHWSSPLYSPSSLALVGW